MVYISILRGINVSGQKLIKMDALRALYENLGFKDVTTYVQSGNVVFNTKTTDVLKLEKKIAAQINTEFGYEVPVLVLTIDQLKKVIQNNPFLKDKQKDVAFFHVTFLSQPPVKNQLTGIEEKKTAGEAVALVDTVIYLYCPNGYGKTKLTNNFIETKLKVDATTRNWKTVNELYKMAVNE
jgi:uncharacterized protein (DUF1697 family)